MNRREKKIKKLHHSIKIHIHATLYKNAVHHTEVISTEKILNEIEDTIRLDIANKHYHAIDEVLGIAKYVNKEDLFLILKRQFSNREKDALFIKAEKAVAEAQEV